MKKIKRSDSDYVNNDLEIVYKTQYMKHKKSVFLKKRCAPLDVGFSTFKSPYIFTRKVRTSLGENDPFLL